MGGTASRWRLLAREALRLNLDQADLGGSLRCSVGVMIPLAAGLAAGGIADGLSAAIGALCAGFASFQGAYRARVSIIVVVAAGTAVATVTGALADHADWSAILVVTVWGGIAALMASLGPAALVVGLQFGVAAIVVNAFEMTTGQALVRGAFMLLGGLIQGVLTVISWSTRAYPAERRAIAAAYRELAGFASGAVDPERAAELTGVPTMLDAAREALRDPQPLGRAAQLLAFQALSDEAERIRSGLLALARVRRDAAASGARVEALDELFSCAATTLGAVATSVLADTAPTGGSGAKPALDGATDTLPGGSGADTVAASQRSGTVAPVPPVGLSPAGAGGVVTSVVTERLRAATDRVRARPIVDGRAAPWVARDADRLAAGLAGQLRSAVRIAAESAGGLPADPARPDRPQSHRGEALRETLVTLRANLSWRSGGFRHVLRVMVSLACAMTIYRLSGLEHGYWIALTVLVVLRPDFVQTTVRGLGRIAGTLAGAGLATMLVVGLHPDETGLTVLLGITVLLAFTTVRVNYALFSVFVTSFVVFLLGFASLPAASTAVARVVNTLIGGGVALGAYLLWPTWASRFVGDQLATLLEAQAAYSGGLLACFGDPAGEARDRLGELRAATRLARSNLEVSLGRMASEPDRSLANAPIGLGAARALAAAGRRVSFALVRLHAHLPTPDSDPLDGLGALGTALARTLRREAANLAVLVTRPELASPLRARISGGGIQKPVPAPGHDHRDYELRRAHDELEARLGLRADQGDLAALVVLAETDVLVDAVNSIAHLVPARTRPGPSAQ